MAHWSDRMWKFLYLYVVVSIFKSVLAELLQPLLLFLPSLDPYTREELVEESSQALDQHFSLKKIRARGKYRKRLLKGSPELHSMVSCDVQAFRLSGMVTCVAALGSWATLAPFNPHEGV